jgi:hypothetical protein
VVASEKLQEKGLELARMVASRGPVAVKMSKHLVQRGQDLDLANANAMEADVFGFLCASEDKHEGMAAFLAKRADSRDAEHRARRLGRPHARAPKEPACGDRAAYLPKPAVPRSFVPLHGVVRRVVTQTVLVKLATSVPSARARSTRYTASLRVREISTAVAVSVSPPAPRYGR